MNLETIARELACHAPRPGHTDCFSTEPPAWARDPRGEAEKCGYCGSWIEVARDACPSCGGDHLIGLTIRAKHEIEKEAAR